MTLPLAGIKVVDLSEHGFVPSAAAVLADWGADVVKIERAGGDPMRTTIANGMVPTVDGIDFMYELVNRNKRGLGLDIESEAGRAVFERLVRWADVYVTNQLPRVRRKLRTEPADLFAINAKLVFAKGSGQGQRGADAEAGGFDAVSYWARGGVGHMLSDPNAERPTQQRPALGDIPSGGWLAGAICAALIHSMRTGKGVVVDTSLLNGAMWALGPDMAYTSLGGEEMPLPADAVRSPLTHTYRTSDGRFVTLMMLDEARYWDQCCRSLGLEDLAASLATPEERRMEWVPTRERFRDKIATLTKAELEARLRAAGCIYSFFNSPTEVIHDRAVIDNGYLMQHPRHGRLRLSAAPAQFDDEQLTIRRPGPELGEHSREILAELGYAAAEIDALVSEGSVIGR